MVLLTSGHVSLFLSAGVVFLCTMALFVAGIVLQQQTVNNMHHALKPHNARMSAAKISEPTLVAQVNTTPASYLDREETVELPGDFSQNEIAHEDGKIDSWNGVSAVGWEKNDEENTILA